MGKLEISGITKSFGAVKAVDAVSLDVAAGETIVLLGPSGCGKTTLLRLIAGFMRPDGGTIRIADRLVASPGVMVPPEKRSLSMVFQSYAVWPHKTVAENLAYGLKLRRLDRAVIKRKVEDGLAVVKMQGYAERYPSELSGGQQQRVALARALVLEPEILLFDEPLSNLDAALREHMRFEIKALLQKLAITAIYVTHDQHEAMVVADRIAVMNRGRIEQLDTADALYHSSATEFVARFIGLANVIEAHVIGAVEPGFARVRCGLGEVVARCGRVEATPGRRVQLIVRPESVVLAATPSAGWNVVQGRISRRSFLGAQIDYMVDVNDTPVRVIAPSRLATQGLADETLVAFKPADCFLLPLGDGQSEGTGA